MASFLDTLFGGGAQEDAAAKNAAALQSYQTTANTALGQGYSTGSQALNSAVGAYQPLANLGTQYSAATPIQLGALGIGSPDQIAAAKNAFTAGPGYDFQMDQGLQALARQHAAAGNPISGNADIDAMTFGQGLANQTYYQNWLPAVTGAANTGVSATGAAAAGQAAGYGSLANLATQYGEDTSGVASGVASGTMADNNMVAAGQAAGAKNLLGAGLSLATLGLGGNPFGGSMTGGGGGGSSLLSSLGGAVGNAFLPNNLFSPRAS